MNGDKLPSGWETVQIGDVVKPARSAVTVEPDTLYREIGIRSHGKGIFYKEPISGKDLGDKRVFWIEPGCFVVNIVFAWEGAVAQTTLSELGMIASHRFPMYKPDADRLDLDFITYFFKSKKGIHLLGLASPGGAGRNKTLGQQNFLQLQIPLPPLKEQKKMAAILQTCDEAIDLTEQLIAAKQRRKQALMQRLLTGQVRFPGFEDEWEMVTLDNVTSKVGSGITPRGGSESYLASGIPLIRSQNVLTGRLNLEDVAFISEEQHNKMSATRLKAKDVLLNITGASIGRSCVVPVNFIEGNVNQHVCIIRPTDQLNSTFLSAFLNSAIGQRQIDAFQAGGNRQGLNYVQIRSFKLPLPTIEEQEKVAQILQTCDQELALHQQKLAALRRQKQGLMQQLLTGRVRVAG
jgi:type I restriction enzyme S subunit